MGLLDGKVAIVTGAGRGIGREEALFLAGEGAAVVVNDLGGETEGGGSNEGPAREVGAEITAAGGRAAVSGDDISTWAGAERVVQTALDAFGRLDILVNNAGILRDKPLVELEQDDWETVVRVHAQGHAAMAHFAARHWTRLAEQGGPSGGRIINTSSESGLYGMPGQTAYAAAKSGIASMTMAWARELKGLGVTVNAIAPRARTRMVGAFRGPAAGSPAAGAMQVQKEGLDNRDPAHIPPVVAWLASDFAADITGRVFVIVGDTVILMDPWSEGVKLTIGHRWTVEELEGARIHFFADRRPALRDTALLPL